MTVEIVCPQCRVGFTRQAEKWTCPQCGYTVKLLDGKPVFTDVPMEINPSEKIERSAEQGSAWRQFNWKFIEKVSNDIPPGADVLDVGAGRGDFKKLFTRHAYLGLDVYPYPELDLAADLINTCPFKESTFDLVVLANVIEHVYEYRALVARCASLLKPGGRLLVTVPFLLKLHQEPVDFQRYTRYSLEKMALDNGLVVERLDGYYNPLALLDEGIGNTWQYGLPKLNGVANLLGKAGIFIAQRVSNLFKRYLGNGYIAPAALDANPNVLGYQCLLQKPQ